MKFFKLFVCLVAAVGESAFSGDAGITVKALAGHVIVHRVFSREENDLYHVVPRHEPTAPVKVLRSGSAGSRSIFFQVVKETFGFICHQEPSRLMSIDGTEVPLCPRCIGLQTGLLGSFVLSLFTRGRVIYEGKSCRFLLMFAIALTGIQWSLGHMGMVEPGVDSRLLTGLITGAGLGILLQSYRRGRLIPRSTPTVVVSMARVIGIIGFSTIFVFIVRDLSSWSAFVGIIVVSLLVNVTIVIHAAAQILRARRLHLTLFHSSNTGGPSWTRVQ